MKMKLGVFVGMGEDDISIDAKFKKLKDNGFSCCQLSTSVDEVETDEKAAEINAAKEKYGIEIVAYWWLSGKRRDRAEAVFRYDGRTDPDFP